MSAPRRRWPQFIWGGFDLERSQTDDSDENPCHAGGDDPPPRSSACPGLIGRIRASGGHAAHLKHRRNWWAHRMKRADLAAAKRGTDSMSASRQMNQTRSGLSEENKKRPTRVGRPKHQ